jgi:hypothetical protein
MHETQKGVITLLLLLCYTAHTMALDTSSTFIDAVRDYGAKADGSDAEPAIQAALDAAFVAGGGMVFLPHGVYSINRPLIIKSNVHLRGAGVGATVIQAMSSDLIDKVINGAGVWASIAMIAADHASIRNLTVDHWTNRTIDNGIALLPDGADWSGTPSTNCVVEQVQVLGGGNSHSYMIWNLRGQYNKIINNFVDGNVGIYTPGSSQEGIESYGGRGVLISGNTVQNIGNTCLNIGSAGLPNSNTVAITIANNFVQNCNQGINLGPAKDSSGLAQNPESILINNNVIVSIWKTGIYAIVAAGTMNDDILITGNTIRNVGTVGVNGSGINFQGDPTTAITPSSVRSNTVSGNHIENVVGTNSFGILIVQYPNVHVIGNTIVAPGHSGIYGLYANDLEVSANRIVNSARSGVAIEGTTSRPIVKNNTIWAWGMLADSAGIRIAAATGGMVMGNAFYHTRNVHPSAIRVEAASSTVVVSENTLLYDPMSSVPFVNAGQNPNRGTFRARSGQPVITVSNTLVTDNSLIVVNQTEGPPTTFSVTPFSGFFQVSLPAANATGAEEFIYQILP